jgi:hypothetical protein
MINIGAAQFRGSQLTSLRSFTNITFQAAQFSESVGIFNTEANCQPSGECAGYDCAADTELFGSLRSYFLKDYWPARSRFFFGVRGFS